MAPTIVVMLPVSRQASANVKGFCWNNSNPCVATLNTANTTVGQTGPKATDSSPWSFLCPQNPYIRALFALTILLSLVAVSRAIVRSQLRYGWSLRTQIAWLASVCCVTCLKVDREEYEPLVADALARQAQYGTMARLVAEADLRLLEEGQVSHYVVEGAPTQGTEELANPAVFTSMLKNHSIIRGVHEELPQRQRGARIARYRAYNYLLSAAKNRFGVISRHDISEMKAARHFVNTLMGDRNMRNYDKRELLERVLTQLTIPDAHEVDAYVLANSYEYESLRQNPHTPARLAWLLSAFGWVKNVYVQHPG